MSEIKRLNLQLFAEANTNTTADSGMTVEMKTFYSDYIIDNAEAKLVHDQFAQKHPIPKNGGKTIEFRKLAPLPKALTPITEGVTPDGKKMTWSKLEATIQQYGDYIELTDMLLLSAIDDNLVHATRILGVQAGETLDTITREVLNGGTNVQYAEGQVSARNALVGGKETGNHYLTVKAVQMAARFLKTQKAEKINGYYVAIAHPDVLFDLMRDPEWISASEYAGSTQIFEGEVGKIASVRFVETTEAKIFAGAGAEGRDVYSTLVLGADAYGTTEITGGGLQHIVKQLGSSGTADPLNQRATVGWKATKVSERLVESFMIRIETASTFASGAN